MWICKIPHRALFFVLRALHTRENHFLTLEWNFLKFDLYSFYQKALLWLHNQLSQPAYRMHYILNCWSTNLFNEMFAAFDYLCMYLCCRSFSSSFFAASSSGVRTFLASLDCFFVSTTFCLSAFPFVGAGAFTWNQNKNS